MHNHGAFAPEDVEDARRGHPAVELSAYAAARGLDFRGQQLSAHVSGVNPLWVDYVFNSMRGQLGAGRFGVLQHELYEVPLGDDMKPYGNATYHGVRARNRAGVRALIGLSQAEKNEPFGRQAMWLPTTSVKLLVPEAALLPRVVIATAAHLPFSDPGVGPLAPAHTVSASTWMTPELHAAVAQALGPALSSLPFTFSRLELSCGALGLTVNGYVTDPNVLDLLIRSAATLAEGAVALGRPWWQPGAFAEPLGPFDATQHPGWYRSFASAHEPSGMEALARHAAELSMTVEDPVALHRRFPRLAAPGISRGVLWGVLPGTTVPARLSWQFQDHPGSSSYLRGAGLFAARSDAPELPAGGVLVESTDMYVEVRDGVAVCWSRPMTLAELRSAELAGRAVASVRATGVADV